MLKIVSIAGRLERPTVKRWVIAGQTYSKNFSVLHRTAPHIARSQFAHGQSAKVQLMQLCARIGYTPH